jgi:hypothetical protein
LFTSTSTAACTSSTRFNGIGSGNEVIDRVVELLAQSRLPSGALSAQVSGDQFAMVLPAGGVAGPVVPPHRGIRIWKVRWHAHTG